MGWLSRLLHEEGFSLMRSSLVSVAIKAAAIALVMATSVALARHLGAADYGRFAFIQSIALYLRPFPPWASARAPTKSSPAMWSEGG